MKTLNFKRYPVLLILMLQSVIIHGQLPIIGFGDQANYRIDYFNVPGSSGLDLHWHGGIRFGDNTGNNVMQIMNGNVGIGTTNFDLNSISQKLLININGVSGSGIGMYSLMNIPGQYVPIGVQFSSGNSNNGAQIRFGIGTTDTRTFISFATANGGVPLENVRIAENGNVGIGTTNFDLNSISQKLLINVNGVSGSGIGMYSLMNIPGQYVPIGVQFSSGNSNNGAQIRFGIGTTDTRTFISFATANGGVPIENVRIAENGNVGIGSTNPDSKLTVKGKIHTEEVKIDLAVPADYVFEKYYLGKSSLKPDYTLLTLSEVEKFIEENHHLPNVPSAKEIKGNGLMVGEMSNVLLQKIEELTLYSIEQQKTIEKLEKENGMMKEENDLIKKNQIELEKRLLKIENKL